MPDQRAQRHTGSHHIDASRCDDALYRALVERADEYAGVVLDLEGRVVRWNRGAERLLGYHEEEILGQPVAVIFTPEDRRDRVPEREMAAALDDGLAHGRHCHVRKDGTRFDADRGLERLCDENGTPIGFTMILRDLTDRTSAEQESAAAVEALREVNSRLLAAGIREQEARNEAETANRGKDEFLAIVSHELRTPLNAIFGWAQLLRTKAADPGLVARALESIERSAMLQRTIIDDLLDVSRILSGRLRLTLSPVELGPVMLAAIDGVRQAAEAKQIGIDCALDPSIDPVAGDPERLHQVVSNLLSNSVKFTPAGGRIEVVLTREDEHACIRVHDTGRGIDPEFLPYVFDRFRQGDTTTRREYGGLGLGLAIARHLVERQRGTIHAESAGEGRGSTFTVRLPLAAPTSRAAAAEPGESRDADASALDDTPRLDGVRVLLVDDDPDALAVYVLLLEPTGARVTTAGSARAALAIFEHEPPDVLVSDIGMPGEDGYDLIRLVRARDPERGGRVPAAALTAYASQEDLTRCVRAGYQTHIGKPVVGADLVAVIASLASGLTPSVHSERTLRQGGGCKF